MIMDFFEWYETRIREVDEDPIYVWQHGEKRFDQYRKNGGIVRAGDTDFIFKLSHSRYYKNHRKQFSTLPVTSRMLDNRLALGSELLSQKKYRAFKFMTAMHYPIEWNHEFYVISPNLLKGYADYLTASEIGRDPYMEMPRESRGMKKALRLPLKKLLSQKKRFLNMMTEDCFDQYVEYLLASVFEFSDDEHANNIMFVRNRGSEKFESLFVFDKESTIFNPFIAMGQNFNDVRMNSILFDKYAGKFIAFPGETIIERVHEIGELVQRGKLEPKYIKFLNQLANFDYCEAARQIYHETGKKINQNQLDMYRLGSEYAAQTLER